MPKVHNHFFYQPKDMPWKTPTNCEVPYAIQNKGKNSSGKEGEEVAGAEEAPDEAGSDGASEGA